MKIIFIGFMAAGKSFFAKRAAEKFGLDIVAMDDLVLEKSGRCNINEIFEKDGEIKFRELEIETARELQGKDNIIIDTGGGVVQNKIIMDYLGKNGIIVFLDSSLDIIEKRLQGDKKRPLFRDIEKFRQLYKLRLPLYREYADVTVDTGGMVFFSVDGKDKQMTSQGEQLLAKVIKAIKECEKYA